MITILPPLNRNLLSTYRVSKFCILTIREYKEVESLSERGCTSIFLVYKFCLCHFYTSFTVDNLLHFWPCPGCWTISLT